VKWFQLDSDMPDDPKIRAVVRALGPAGVGGLVGVWCHVAKHGGLPGQGIDRQGHPLPLDDLLAASLLPGEQFNALIDVCTRTGHFRRDAWERHRGIWIPAMERRADRYAQRLARSKQLEIDWRGDV
jgi:hypothetical protein